MAQIKWSWTSGHTVAFVASIFLSNLTVATLISAFWTLIVDFIFEMGIQLTKPLLNDKQVNDFCDCMDCRCPV